MYALTIEGFTDTVFVTISAIKAVPIRNGAPEWVFSSNDGNF